MLGYKTRSVRGAATVLALALLAACGGSDDGFKLPGVEGAALPYTVMGTLANAERTELRLGGVGSSMAPHPTLPGHFYGLSDRGPNVATAAGVNPPGIIFLMPEFNPRISLYRITSSGAIELVSSIGLKDRNGRPVTGLPNRTFGNTGETPYNLDGTPVQLDPDGDGIRGYDESGIDSEGLVAMPDGTFWVSDEYGPHIVQFDATGREIARINPFATDPRNRAGRVLPAELARRWPNRGMEGLTITPDGRTLVGIMQSNLYNPTRDIGPINLTRIVTVNIETGATAQYLYRQDANGLANSEIVALTATRFAVIERDTNFFGITPGTVRKNVYVVDISAATNVNANNTTLVQSNAAFSTNAAAGLLVNGSTLEEVVKNANPANNAAAGWDQLAALGIRPATKTLAYDGVRAQGYPHDKLEGLWVISPTQLGLLNDDDFAVEPDGRGGAQQKKLFGGGVDRNTLYVVTPLVPLR